jgi:hypothetical protein
MSENSLTKYWKRAKQAVKPKEQPKKPPIEIPERKIVAAILDGVAKAYPQCDRGLAERLACCALIIRTAGIWMEFLVRETCTNKDAIKLAERHYHELQMEFFGSIICPVEWE